MTFSPTRGHEPWRLKLMLWKQTLYGTHGLNIIAFCWIVREIYKLRETLTKNFEANSTNMTESKELTNEQPYKW